MILNLYAIKDKYSGFMSPMIYVNNDVAKREFAMMINSNPGILNFAPGDFDLYCVGTMDNHSGRIEQKEVHEFICNGVEVFVNENKVSESQ